MKVRDLESVQLTRTNLGNLCVSYSDRTEGGLLVYKLLSINFCRKYGWGKGVQKRKDLICRDKGNRLGVYGNVTHRSGVICKKRLV